MENKLLMKLLIGSEAMFFLSLIMAFVYAKYTVGYDLFLVHKLDIKTTGIYTCFLVMSSGTYYLAERSNKRGNQNGLKIWLIATILLGSIFLYGQGSEYMRLIAVQITVSSSNFGTSFYTLTGFHGLHVFIGLITLCIVLLLTFLGDYKKSGASIFGTVGIYWHFVDAVWIVVFTVVYVLPHFS